MTTQSQFAVLGPQRAPAEEQRRSQRVIIRIPVRIHFTLQTKQETVAARTVAVNDHGALLNCARVFPAGTRLEIENERNGQRQVARVLRPPRMTALGFEIPIEFEKVIPNYWGIAFPPTEGKRAAE